MKGQTVSGTYTGTGSAYNLELGFAPDFFVSINYTDGTPIHFWHKDMTDDTTVDVAAAAASNAADGVTPYAGSEGSNSKGLTLGTDLSVSGKKYVYFATANQ